MENYLVYFFSVNDTFVKVGCTYNPLCHRLETMQIGCPYPIKMEGIIRCSSKKEMQETESKFKQDFADFHKHGEWYYISQSVSEFISNSTENGDETLEESRQAIRSYRRERYKINPEVAENARERSRNRWRNDPGYRERSNKREQERRRKNKSKSTVI